MTSNQILTSVRRKSSVLLKKQLEKDITAEEREAILQVLKQRGSIVETEVETKEVETKEVLTQEQLVQLDAAITNICECEDDEIKSEAGCILETVTEYSELTLLQFEQITKLASKISKKVSKPVPVSTPETEKVKSSSPVKRTEVVELSEEEEEFLQSQLKELELKTISKKKFIASFVEKNFNRKALQKALPKGVIDSTYIYDIYKEMGKI